MEHEGLLQWLHEGGILAGRVQASGPGRTAWVGIYPLDLANPHTHDVLRWAGLSVMPGVSLHVYRIQTFEIADELRDTNFGDRDMQNQWSRIVLGDDALFAALLERGIPVEILDSPRRVDYPL